MNQSTIIVGCGIVAMLSCDVSAQLVSPVSRTLTAESFEDGSGTDDPDDVVVGSVLGEVGISARAGFINFININTNVTDESVDVWIDSDVGFGGIEEPSGDGTSSGTAVIEFELNHPADAEVTLESDHFYASFGVTLSGPGFVWERETGGFDDPFIFDENESFELDPGVYTVDIGYGAHGMTGTGGMASMAFSLVVTPEPGTLLTTLAGFGVVALRRVRG